MADLLGFDVRVLAPWNGDQVLSLTVFQSAGVMQPFTCRDPEHGPLVPYTEGWECQRCDYFQGWAHGFMTDWTWRKLRGDAMDSVTASGLVLTDDVVAALADEAERGYDGDQLRPRFARPNVDQLADKMTGLLRAMLGGGNDATVIAFTARDALYQAAGCTCRPLERYTDMPVRADDATCPVHRKPPPT